MAFSTQEIRKVQHHITKLAAKTATDFLMKDLPKEIASPQTLSDSQINTVFSKYRRIIPPIIKDLNKIEPKVNSVLSEKMSHNEAVKTLAMAQGIMLKAYTTIFTLGDVLAKEKASYELVFSEGSKGKAGDVRIANIPLKDLLNYTSLNISKIQKNGKRNLGLGLANVKQLQMLRQQLSMREQSAEEANVGQIMYQMKKNSKVSLARAAELAVAKKYDNNIDINNTEIKLDNAPARTMNDIRQYSSENSLTPRIEVKSFNKYKDWRNSGEIKEGTAGLISLPSLRNDLEAILIIISRTHHQDVNHRIKVLTDKIYNNKTFISKKVLETLSKGIL